jgi:hypothetical protein
VHVYRWDLDRTYLLTEIHSVRGMLRSALESAIDKRTVPGADVLLRGLLAHDPAARATVLSGSPTQLRAVLEEKLTLDGIRYDSIVLKDNLRNLTRGRFRAVRGQLGYKLPQLLALRLDEDGSTTESLFGDDAEVDALIYALYADALAGRADADTVADVMRAGGAYEDQVADALATLAKLEPVDAVTDVWILVDRRLPLAEFAGLGPVVRVVFSWFQAALGLYAAGRLGSDGVATVAERVEPGPVAPRRLAALTQDAVHRGLVPRAAVQDLLAREPRLAAVRATSERLLDLLGEDVLARPPEDRRDWRGFLKASAAFRAT